MNIVARPWRHYADFEGRSSRTEYFLFFIIFYAALFALGMAAVGLQSVRADGVAIVGFIVVGVSFLASIVPSWAVSIRRLHDQGKSGWLVLLSFIPFIGWAFTLIFAFWPGDQYENEFGPNPRDRHNQAGVAEVFT